jgi:uncharacterized protein YfkK (UPF0435 family)
MKHIKFKENLLEDYSKIEPRLLIKCIGHGYKNISLQEEYKIYSSLEPELQDVVEVAILINPYNSTKDDALFLISKIVDRIKNDNEVFGEAKTASEEYYRSCDVNRRLNIIADELLYNLKYEDYSSEELEYIFNRVREAKKAEKWNSDKRVSDDVNTYPDF